MGIKGILKILKRHSPSAFTNIPAQELSNKYIAIDGNNWMYINMAIARKRVIKTAGLTELHNLDVNRIHDEWIRISINFIKELENYNIHCVVIFDGKAPIEKENTKIKRQSAKESNKQKINFLHQQLEKVNSNKEKEQIAIELSKRLQNHVVVKHEELEIFISAIRQIRIPVIIANGDGEQLCSSLCIENKVSAVFSADTDNLVYGCPLLITGIIRNYSSIELECIHLQTVLQSLQLSLTMFVDLCIMCGCDYNTNIPKYGVFKSYNLIKTYHSIDNLPKELDVQCLNHVRCRELFRYKPSHELTKDNLEEIFKDNIKKIVKLNIIK